MSILRFIKFKTKKGNPMLIFASWNSNFRFRFFSAARFLAIVVILIASALIMIQFQIVAQAEGKVINLHMAAGDQSQDRLESLDWDAFSANLAEPIPFRDCDPSLSIAVSMNAIVKKERGKLTHVRAGLAAKKVFLRGVGATYLEPFGYRRGGGFADLNGELAMVGYLPRKHKYVRTSFDKTAIPNINVVKQGEIFTHIINVGDIEVFSSEKLSDEVVKVPYKALLQSSISRAFDRRDKELSTNLLSLYLSIERAKRVENSFKMATVLLANGLNNVTTKSGVQSKETDKVECDRRGNKIVCIRTNIIKHISKTQTEAVRVDANFDHFFDSYKFLPYEPQLHAADDNSWQKQLEAYFGPVGWRDLIDGIIKPKT